MVPEPGFKKAFKKSDVILKNQSVIVSCLSYCKKHEKLNVPLIS